MMRTDTKTGSTRATILLCVACLATAAVMQAQLLDKRAVEIPHHASIVDNAPPSVVFTTMALGGLRGILIDFLWYRASELQLDQQDYVEIVQLSHWITSLEPRLPAVWDFMSFNMAYNVSEMFTRPGDRWEWVKHGISLLRDEGLAYNPESVVLHDRLCRIILHKLVQRGDPGLDYYRMMYAAEMNEVIPGPRVDYDKLAKSPQTVRKLKSDFKLVPEVMKEIEERYGRLDWRLPEAYLIYWATMGMKHTGNEADLAFDSIICNALAATFLNGTLLMLNPAEGEFVTDTRPDVLEAAVNQFQKTMTVHDISMDELSFFSVSYRNFLRAAIARLHDLDDDLAAMRLFKILRDDLNDEDAQQPFEEYVQFIAAHPGMRDPMKERKQRLLKEYHNHCPPGCEHAFHKHQEPGTGAHEGDADHDH